MIQAKAGLKATTISEWLEAQHPDRFSASQLRTLLLIAAMFWLNSLSPAHAQQPEADVLVGNLGQSQNAPGIVVSDTQSVAQRFTTGSHSSGYTITEVAVNVFVTPDQTLNRLCTNNRLKTDYLCRLDPKPSFYAHSSRGT